VNQTNRIHCRRNPRKRVIRHGGADRLSPPQDGHIGKRCGRRPTRESRVRERGIRKSGITRPRPAAALQLPPSTSPETVRGLIADLAAKGAHPVTQPTATSEAAAQPVFNAANVAAQAWKGSKQAVQALPFLRRMPRIWIEQVEADGGTPEVALGLWIVALAGLAAAPLIGVAFRTLVDRQQTRVSPEVVREVGAKRPASGRSGGGAAVPGPSGRRRMSARSVKTARLVVPRLSESSAVRRVTLARLSGTTVWKCSSHRIVMADRAKLIYGSRRARARVTPGQLQ